MKNFEYTIKDELGIHVRPAGLLAKEGKKFASTVKIEKDGKSTDIKKLMAVMAMGIKCGETVNVTVEGKDEDTAFSAIRDFFENNL